MKKIAIFFIIVLIIITSMFYIYSNYKMNIRKAEKENFEFEMYVDEEIEGLDLATIINKAINLNEKNGVQKAKDGKYIENETNSINIDIKFIDTDVIYNIEKIYDFGIDEFLSNYRTIHFKCIDIQYHKKTGKIKYMQFEQLKE